jgi:2-polyprenyl-3-methyl-5-hydroxy-6-metoxy-1,4-benzoquinol methylase
MGAIATAAITSRPPAALGLAHDLARLVGGKNRMQAPFFARALSGLPAADLGELEAYLAHALDNGASLELLAASYDLVVRDTLREQIFFRRNGRYRHSRYEEVAASVYQEPEYMTRYMHGLAITAFVWPNHAAIRRWFERAIRALPPGGSYLEVGPGHGLYLIAALREGAFERALAVDLSPTSVELTEKLLASRRFGRIPKCDVELIDFLSAKLPGEQAVITMGEVLEHVEQPEAFLKRASELVASSGRVVITTCIDSPAIDHIYRFESTNHVLSMARDAGLEAIDTLELPHEGTSLEECAREKLPINIAMVLRRAR